jgi:hypothetical protein
VQDNTQQRSIYLQPAVVFDEAHLLKSIHEKIDARARSTNHFRERLLRYFGKHPVDLIQLAIAGQQQKRARQPLLAGVEKLVDQVLLDPDIASKHIGDKAIGKRTFRMEQSEHFAVLDHQHTHRCNGSGRCHSHLLPCQSPLTYKVTWL